MRILHFLSQRPGRTGSGVTLDAVVRHADLAGHRQWVVVGTPAQDPTPAVGGLPAERILPLVFERPGLELPLPGMSDVMPYPSTVWSEMTDAQLEQYRGAWRRQIRVALDIAKPDVIHTHHIWLLTSLVRELAPETPMVTACHATGLRQLRLCPRLADEVLSGCRGVDRFAVLHAEHQRALGEALGRDTADIGIVGAGYRDAVFNRRRVGSHRVPGRIVYAGKYSRSKGVPQLLAAFSALRGQRPEVELHIAGAGGGAEGAEILAELTAAQGVVIHGMLAQEELADLLRSAHTFVLPSFYEGLPLVLVEALACGARVVCTELDGAVRLASELPAGLVDLVAMPPLLTVDRPDPDGLPAFVDRLTDALLRSLDGPTPPRPEELSRFTWAAAYERISDLWAEACNLRGS